MPEEVRKDFFDQAVDGTELLFDEPVNCWIVLEIWNLAESGGDRKEDAVDLRILVDEHQGVWDVVVTFEQLDVIEQG